MVYLMIKELSPCADEVIYAFAFFVSLCKGISNLERLMSYISLCGVGYYCYKLSDEGHEQQE